MPDNTQDILAAVMGRIPSGCSILTATHQGHSTGMLASWIQQASLEPLLLTVAVRQGRPLQQLVDGSGAMVLNLVGAAEAKAMFRHFARGFGLDAAAFEGLETRDCPEGVILSGSLAYLGCRVEDKWRAGDHWLYLVRPIRAEFLNEAEPYVHLRKSAAGY